MATTSALGPLVRLSGMRTADLPAPNATPEQLSTLISSVLKEAVPFIDGVAPKAGGGGKLWKHKGNKSLEHSTADVEVTERALGAGDLPGSGPGEYWVCRRSVHEDAAKKGTAGWGEFVRHFYEDHAGAEERFTPNIVGAHTAMSWDCAAVPAVRVDGEGEGEGEGNSWGGFIMSVQEMRHKVGRPVLKDRTFAVLMVTASRLLLPAETEAGAGEFVVVSIPVVDFEKGEGSRLAVEPGSLNARYVSVERIRRMGNGEVEWLMATASDAGGNLPQWMQNMGMPGVIAKDVQLFIKWIGEERGKAASS